MRAALDATGWSWSGEFGDLDNDGFLDLYVVNGMIEAELFPTCRATNWSSENQALRNDGAGTSRRRRNGASARPPAAAA